MPDVEVGDPAAPKTVVLPGRVIVYSWALGDIVFLRPEDGNKVQVRGRLIGVRTMWGNGSENTKEYLVRYVTPIGNANADWFGERELDSDTT